MEPQLLAWLLYEFPENAVVVKSFAKRRDRRVLGESGGRIHNPRAKFCSPSQAFIGSIIRIMVMG
jgi:hypothetical protein